MSIVHCDKLLDTSFRLSFFTIPVHTPWLDPEEDYFQCPETYLTAFVMSNCSYNSSALSVERIWWYQIVWCTEEHWLWTDSCFDGSYLVLNDDHWIFSGCFSRNCRLPSSDGFKELLIIVLCRPPVVLQSSISSNNSITWQVIMLNSLFHWRATLSLLQTPAWALLQLPFTTTIYIEVITYVRLIDKNIPKKCYIMAKITAWHKIFVRRWYATCYEIKAKIDICFVKAKTYKITNISMKA